MVRERTGSPPSFAMAKKMKSLTLHTHGCPRANSSAHTFASILKLFVITGVGLGAPLSRLSQRSAVQELEMMNESRMMLKLKFWKAMFFSYFRCCSNGSLFSCEILSNWPDEATGRNYKVFRCALLSLCSSLYLCLSFGLLFVSVSL